MSYLGILFINAPNCVTGDVESVLVKSNRLDLHCTALFSFFSSDMGSAVQTNLLNYQRATELSPIPL